MHIRTIPPTTPVRELHKNRRFQLPHQTPNISLIIPLYILGAKNLIKHFVSVTRPSNECSPLYERKTKQKKKKKKKTFLQTAVDFHSLYTDAPRNALAFPLG